MTFHVMDTKVNDPTVQIYCFEVISATAIKIV